MPERTRVLIVIDSMEVAGSQRQVLHLLKGLDRKLWEPELAYFRVDSFLADAARASGINVHYIPKRRRIDPGFLFAYARFLRARNYALVHAFSLTAEVWTLAAGFLAGVRPVLVASERSSFRSDRPPWFWWFKRFVVGRSSAVIANSHAGAASTADRIGAPASCFHTVPNAVDIPAALEATRKTAIRRESSGYRDGPVALFVGRLEPLKNLPCLIRAMASLSPGARPTLLIAGEGSQRGAIASLADEFGVASNVRWLGQRQDIPELMQASDYLVLPSHYEGLSNVLLEAMAAGCPVIASAVGGNEELVSDHVTGLLFPDDDAKALAAAMQALVDPGLRSRLAAAARSMVSERYGAAALASSTSTVYMRSLSGRAQATWPEVRHRAQTQGKRT